MSRMLFDSSVSASAPAVGDGGGTFSGPTLVDDGNPLGRVQLRLLGPGSAVVVWLESLGDAAEWRAKRVSRYGDKGFSIRLGSTARTREAGFSRIALLDSDLFVAWSEPGPQGRVRVIRVPLNRLPAR